MKILSFILGLIAINVAAAQAPIIRGPLTTNTPTISSNFVRNISSIQTNTISTNSYTAWKIACWGDSTSQFYPTELVRMSGREVFNGSFAGMGTWEARNQYTNAAYNYLRDWSRVFFIGANDPLSITGFGTNSVDQMLINVAEMVTNGGPRFLVLGALGRRDWPAGDTNYNIITNFNARLALTYTNHYFDMRAWMITRTNGSAADATDKANDVFPNSLAFDVIHPNVKGQSIIAAKAMEKLVEIETNLVDRVVTRGELSKIFTQPHSTGPLLIHKPVGLQTISNVWMQVVDGDGEPIFTLRADGELSGIYAGNTFLGYRSGHSNVNAHGNTALGNDAMNYQRSGMSGIAVGAGSQFKVVSGNENTSIGVNSLWANSTGSRNSAVGFYSLFANIGSDNTAYGYQSMLDNTSGARNTGLGKLALGANTTGTDNTAVGESSLQANTSSIENTAVGRLSLSSNTTGERNSVLGHFALWKNKTGSFNTALGTESGVGAFGDASVESTNDNYMVFVGYRASRDASIPGVQLANSIAIGKGAKVFASNQAVIGGTGADSVGLVTHGTNTFNGTISVSPANTVTPVGWLALTNGGVRYYQPLYQ